MVYNIIPYIIISYNIIVYIIILYNIILYIIILHIIVLYNIILYIIMLHNIFKLEDLSIIKHYSLKFETGHSYLLTLRRVDTEIC